MDKLNRAIAVAIVCFFMALAIVVGMRMDQNTIALLGGTTIGLLIAAPTAAIATYMAMRNRDEHSYERGSRFHSPMPQPPPQYWVMPQQQQLAQQQPNPTLPQPIQATGYPAYPTQQPAHPSTQYVLPQVRRRFYMIGEAGEVDELDENAAEVAMPVASEL